MTQTVVRTQVRKKSQLTLPQEVRNALHLADGDEVEFTVTDSGEVTMRGMTVIPTDQRWFWTQQWQAGEKAASKAIAAGETTVHESAEDFLAHLDELDAKA